MKTRGNTQKLVISNVSMQDAGTYTYLGGSETFAYAELAVDPIQIVQPLKDITEAETAKVELTVGFNCPGTKGKWFKDGKPVEVGTFVSI